MIPTSFFGQLIKLGQLLISSPIYFGLFVIFVLLFCFLFLNVKRDNVVVKICISVLFLTLMIFAILGYHKSIFLGIDYLMGQLVLNLYFPSLAIYVIVLGFSYLVFVYTIFSKRFSLVIKRINVAFFTIIQFLFSVFLLLVITKKIDVSSRIMMYQSTDMTIVLQISMILFIFWLLTLLIAHYVQLIRKHFFHHS